MKRRHVVLCIGIAMLSASQANAQTAHTYVHWYVDTPYGPIGYHAYTFGGPVIHRIELGPCGSTVLTTHIIAGLTVVAVLTVAAAGLWLGIRRRRAAAALMQKNTIDVSGAVRR